MFLGFLFPHKHADTQIYRNFMQWIEAYEDHSPVIKAVKMLCNATIWWGQTGGGAHWIGIGKDIGKKYQA